MSLDEIDVYPVDHPDFSTEHRAWLKYGLLRFMPCLIFITPSSRYKLHVNLAVAVTTSCLVSSLVSTDRKLEFMIPDWDLETLKGVASWLHTGTVHRVDLRNCMELTVALDYLGADAVVLNRLTGFVVRNVDVPDLSDFFTNLPHLLTRPLVISLVRRFETGPEPQFEGPISHQLHRWWETKTVMSAMFLSNFGNRLQGTLDVPLMNLSDSEAWKVLCGTEMQTFSSAREAKEYVCGKITSGTFITSPAGMVSAMHILHVVQGIKNFARRPFAIKPAERVVMILAVRENPVYYRKFWWPVLWSKCKCQWLAFVGPFPASLEISTLVQMWPPKSRRPAVDNLLGHKPVKIPDTVNLKLVRHWMVEQSGGYVLRTTAARYWLKKQRALAPRCPGTMRSLRCSL